jgi:hypothetical protein
MLNSFDCSFKPQIPKALILDLATVRSIPEHGGLLVLGPPGTGKSHIAFELDRGRNPGRYTALYRSAFDPAQDLAEAEATGTGPEFVRKLLRVDLLVIEDLGKRHLPPTAAEAWWRSLPALRIWCDSALIQPAHPRLGDTAGTVALRTDPFIPQTSFGSKAGAGELMTANDTAFPAVPTSATPGEL